MARGMVQDCRRQGIMRRARCETFIYGDRILYQGAVERGATLLEREWYDVSAGLALFRYAYVRV